MSWVAAEVATPLINKLSTRQREVLQLVNRGLTNQEIGVALSISGLAGDTTTDHTRR